METPESAAEPEQPSEQISAPGATEAAPAAETHEIENSADLLDALLSRPDDEISWYRGHSKADYSLLPSLARPPRSPAGELPLFKRFQQHAFPFVESVPLTEWEWLFLMQHHGAPTRLLDWTDSPLIALWFATRPRKEECDGCVWTLRPLDLNKAARIATVHPLDIPLFGQDKVLNNYLPTEIDGSPASNTPAAGIASRRFSRLIAQMGSFTITHRDQMALDEHFGSCLTKYVVPAGRKDAVRRELHSLRVTKLAVFPELSNVAEVAEEGLWPDEESEE